MKISRATVKVVQAAGASVHKADQHFKDLIKELGKEIGAQFQSGAFASNSDTVIQRWKDLAGVSQELAKIEAELQAVFAKVTGLQNAIALGRKTVRGKATVVNAGIKAGTKRGRRGRKPGSAGNPARLLSHLQTLLNASEFVRFSQSAAARATGIPIGSITAALKRLVQDNKLVAGPESGSYKLTAL